MGMLHGSTLCWPWNLSYSTACVGIWMTMFKTQGATMWPLAAWGPPSCLSTCGGGPANFGTAAFAAAAAAATVASVTRASASGSTSTSVYSLSLLLSFPAGISHCAPTLFLLVAFLVPLLWAKTKTQELNLYIPSVSEFETFYVYKPFHSPKLDLSIFTNIRRYIYLYFQTSKPIARKSFSQSSRIQVA